MEIKVIYEDNHIIVCEKPSGILSQAGPMDKNDMLSLVKNYIKIKYEKPGNVFLGLVHRLDLNVGGVMVFARTSKAASRLSDTIRKREFMKKYLAIVKGKMKLGQESILEDYLEKDNENRVAVIGSQQNGKLAKLKYKVLANREINGEFYSLVDIDLLTGRFHQIRAQFAHHGHPLYGDLKYGEAKIDGNFFIGLFAYEIEFKHPVKDEIMKFKILPKEKVFDLFKNEIEKL